MPGGGCSFITSMKMTSKRVSELHSMEGNRPCGNIEIIDQELSKKYFYPLKIVVSIQPDEVLVITAYPLRRGPQR